MTALSDLRPAHKLHVMDLVRDAGVDVSDWRNFKGGAKRARMNPKYCYEWAFEQAGEVVVLNCFLFLYIASQGPGPLCLANLFGRPRHVPMVQR